ncbi:MAG: hypothetical protein Ta2E_01970 [Mycoplasmoidaceae bacterium]|nr:MAG: hypothetical protein Ta2E_01970 [Mycoplasmoidaceae bacterium]
MIRYNKTITINPKILKIWWKWMIIDNIKSIGKRMTKSFETLRRNYTNNPQRLRINNERQNKS